MTKLEKRLIKLTTEWKKKLGLQDWTIHVSIEESRGDTARACVLERHWEYKYAVIEFYTRTMRNDDPADIEKHVVHELLHVVLSELECKKKKHEERVITTLAEAICEL